MAIVMEFFKAFKGVKIRRMQPKCEHDPRLHGYWGNGLHTISNQSVLMGIPAIQLEIPRSMREKMVKDDKLFQGFCQAIANGYKVI